MTALAIDIENLTKTYEEPRGWRRHARVKPITAVRDVTLQVHEGELFGLLGPNGAGKTTLVKMLCTLVLPSSGGGTVAGYELQQDRAIRAVTGLVVSDERSFYWRLSARRNLMFYAALYGLTGEVARKRIDTVLADVDLLPAAEQRFSGFSSGMKQRLAIARALLHQPRILFLDEPSRSLDPLATKRLHDLIWRLQERHVITVFLITHDLVEAEKLCQRVAVMDRGRLRTVGHPDALRRALQPRRQYLMVVDPLSETLRHAISELVPDLQRVNEGTLEGIANAEQWRFTTGGDGPLPSRLFAVLQENEIALHHLESKAPTLEEVFAFYADNGEDEAWSA